MLAMVPLGTPGGAVLHNPIQERFLETDIVTCLLTLDPFVPKNLLTLRQKLFVEQRLSDEFRMFFLEGVHAEVTEK